MSNLEWRSRKWLPGSGATVTEVIGPHDCLFGNGATEIVRSEVVDDRLGTPGRFASARSDVATA